MSKSKPERIISEIALSFLTPPTMIMSMLGKNALQMLEEIGKSSEEIFRGERLPILNQHDLSVNSEQLL